MKISGYWEIGATELFYGRGYALLELGTEFDKLLQVAIGVAEVVCLNIGAVPSNTAIMTSFKSFATTT